MQEIDKHKILVITGAAGAGKDTLAMMIKEYIYGTNQRLCGLVDLKFSAPLKEVCALVFGWDEDALDDLDYKEKVFTTSESLLSSNPDPMDTQARLWNRRSVLQHLGTDVFRKMDPDVWVKAALRRARDAYGYIDGWISTDCRFPNEATALKDAFADTYFVNIRRGGPSMTLGSSHASEIQQLPEPDMYLHAESGAMATLRDHARMLSNQFYPELLED
jgi:energy-coupling factor transporter ATP-binding protein EcfA2